jgi:hypothetical protein
MQATELLHGRHKKCENKASSKGKHRDHSRKLQIPKNAK